ncbi:MAG TPA: hypothetical protein VFD37_05235, partial [Solirubrobacterales bacterium]|nr:hypothetical protein [Solirubrobacterales bacterium]
MSDGGSQRTGGEGGEKLSRRWVIRGAILLVIVVVAAVLVLSGDDGADDGAAQEAQPTRVVTVDELSEIADDSDFPIFWAGEIEGTEIELTQG